MALMSLRSRSHVKASMVLTRADHLFIHNYIILYLNNYILNKYISGKVCFTLKILKKIYITYMKI